MAVEDIGSRVDSCHDMFHPVDVKVLDLYKNNVIYFNRSLSWCLQTIEVSSSPEGEVIGRVRKEWTWWHQNYKIQNRSGETVLRIKGPGWISLCDSNINFKVIFERIRWQFKWHLLMDLFLWYFDRLSTKMARKSVKYRISGPIREIFSTMLIFLASVFRRIWMSK